MSKETSYRIDCDTGMLNRLVSMICAIPLSSISDTLWSQRLPGGEGDVSPCLQPVKLLWRQIPMTTAILNMKKATKTAKAEERDPAAYKDHAAGSDSAQASQRPDPTPGRHPALPKGNAMSGDCATSST